MSIKLLLSLADANKTLEPFIAFLDLDQLIRKMLEIYTEKIRSNVKAILNGESFGLKDPYHQKIIESGFDIFILMSILKDSAPFHQKLSLFTIDFNNSTKKNTINLQKSDQKYKTNLNKFKINLIVPLDFLRKKGSIFKIPIDSYNLLPQNAEIPHINTRDNSKTSISLSNSQEGNENGENTDDLEFKNELQMCLFFYQSLVGKVEIVNNGVLRKIYFPKPFFSIYLTENIRRNLLIEARKDFLKSRLEHLLRNIERYKDEMLHFRMIGRLKVLNYLVKSWRIIKDISLIVIFFIIIFLLSDNSGSYVSLNQIVTIIQLILGVFVAVFCIVERYPMSMGLNYPFQNEINRYLKIRHYYYKPRIHKTNFRYAIFLNIAKLYKRLEIGHLKVLKIFLDYENLYNLLYLAMTVIAFNNPFFYSLMLLDIIKRSRILQNIIRAVTNNWIQLLKLSVLCVIILHIFGVISYQEYPQRFQEVDGRFSTSSYGEYLWLAFFSTVNLGLREQGGFGSVLIGPKISNFY